MLTFKNEEERQEALIAIPDEPPPGVEDMEKWLEEQRLKEREILEAEISEEGGSEPGSPEPITEPKPVSKKDDAVKLVVSEEEDLVDFSEIGKIKRSELPEDLRQYRQPKQMLEQFAHARRYANTAQTKLEEYERKISDLTGKVNAIPDLEKKIKELSQLSLKVQRDVSSDPTVTKQGRDNLNKRLEAINSELAKLKSDDTYDTEPLQNAISGTVEAFKSTFDELSSVRTEFAQYKKTNEDKYKNLEERINSVSSYSKAAEEKRKADAELKMAMRNLEDLQRNNPELKTTKPIYAEDKDDVESALVKMAARVYGRSPKNFDEINRMIGAYNAKDPELGRILKTEGISVADYGINDTDVRNYAISMEVYWRQRGERIDPSTGQRVPVTDWRGRKVTFPDFQSAFDYMKKSGGITRSEEELKIIEAEKKAQESLSASLNKRDISTPVLEPTSGDGGSDVMTEETALEVIGEKEGRFTVDEERMERLLREGDKRGWEMFKALQKAHEALGLPVPKPESHWRKAA